jgi:hypothetical protein
MMIKFSQREKYAVFFWCQKRKHNLNIIRVAYLGGGMLGIHEIELLSFRN